MRVVPRDRAAGERRDHRAARRGVVGRCGRILQYPHVPEQQRSRIDSRLVRSNGRHSLDRHRHSAGRGHHRRLHPVRLQGNAQRSHESSAPRAGGRRRGHVHDRPAQRDVARPPPPPRPRGRRCPGPRASSGPTSARPTLSAEIQEIVSRPGWASGHALAVTISGTGHRTAWAWDGNRAQAPLLHVEYSTQTVDLPPVAHLSVSQLASPEPHRVGERSRLDRRGCHTHRQLLVRLWRRQRGRRR